MASSTTARAKEIIAKLDQFEVDMHLVNTWVHGADNLTVLLGGVSTPTIKNLVKNFRMSAQEILDAADYIHDNYEGLEDIIDANREYAEIAETLLLKIADWMARDLAEFNAINIELYNRWYDHGIEEIQDANLVALQAKQNIRDLMDAFDESYAQHRLMKRLFDGTNPTSSSKPVLFVISGQSNAVGSGEYTPFDSARDCGWLWSWFDGANALKPIADPFAAIQRGSGWCAFARRFFALTGRKVILLNIASGGASVTDYGTTENTWADNAYGTLRASRQNVWNAFHSAVPASSYDLGAILWVQGESDAGRNYYEPVLISMQAYKAATLDILNWTRNLIGAADCPVFIGKIGFNITGTTNANYRKSYEAVQKAQGELVNNEDIFDGFSMAPYFADAWDEYMKGTIHYSPRGYRIQGHAFARSVVNYLNF